MTSTFSPLDEGMSTTQISLSSRDLSNLRTAGKWGRFLAIVWLVFMALGALLVIGFGSTIAALAGPEAAVLMGGAAFTITYLLILALYVYPLVMLYKFSSNIIKAVDGHNSVLASEAFASLKSMFKFIGILMAITLGFYVLMILLSILGGIASGL